MIAFCDRVLEYTRGPERAAFVADRMRHDAALRQGLGNLLATM